MTSCQEWSGSILSTPEPTRGLSVPRHTKKLLTYLCVAHLVILNQTSIRQRLYRKWKEGALCGDANPRQIERQSCAGRYHTMGQAWVQALHCGFGDSRKIRRLVTCANDPWHFEPESTGFDRLSRTTTVPSFKSMHATHVANRAV